MRRLQAMHLRQDSLETTLIYVSAVYSAWKTIDLSKNHTWFFTNTISKYNHLISRIHHCKTQLHLWYCPLTVDVRLQLTAERAAIFRLPGEASHPLLAWTQGREINQLDSDRTRQTEIFVARVILDSWSLLYAKEVKKGSFFLYLLPTVEPKRWRSMANFANFQEIWHKGTAPGYWIIGSLSRLRYLGNRRKKSGMYTISRARHKYHFLYLPRH